MNKVKDFQNSSQKYVVAMSCLIASLDVILVENWCITHSWLVLVFLWKISVQRFYSICMLGLAAVVS